MDRIRLVGIEAWAHHGVLPHERAIGQRFLVDVTLHLDLTAAAAASDELADTVHYGEVASAVHAALVGPPADLVEVVAARCAEVALAADARIERVDVALHKPGAPVQVPLTDVVIELSRTRG